MFTRLTGGRRQFASAAAIAIASAIAGAPIRSASQDQPRPTFRTEANYVRVDAYATTKDGVPIDDLRRDEFELLEDRVPQTTDASLIDASGATVASSHLSILPASLSVQWAVGPRALPAGDYELRVRANAASPGSTATDSLRVTVPATADGAGFLLFKRGPGTGNREIATADLRVRRSDTLRVAVPASDSSESSARLLDRTGKVLQVPVSTSMRDEADGSTSRSATLALAPLAAGDYLIELIASQSTGQTRTLIAFRVVP